MIPPIAGLPSEAVPSSISRVFPLFRSLSLLIWSGSDWTWEPYLGWAIARGPGGMAHPRMNMRGRVQRGGDLRMEIS
jgi:hypothetical protein